MSVKISGSGSYIESSTVTAPANPVAGKVRLYATSDTRLKMRNSGGTEIIVSTGVKGADIASAATTDLSTATGNFVHITGTTTITSFGTMQAGTVMTLVFDAALVLTHNATTLILQGTTNLTTAAGDVLTFISEGSGNWREKARRLAAAAAVAATARWEDGAHRFRVYDSVHNVAPTNVGASGSGDAVNGNDGVWSFRTGATSLSVTAGGFHNNAGSTAPPASKFRFADWLVIDSGAGTNIQREQYLWIANSAMAAAPSATEDHHGFRAIAVAVAANWFATNADGTTETSTDTAVVMDGFTREFTIIRDGTVSIKYYIDGVLKATHTTNFPAGNANFSKLQVKNTEAAAKNFYLMSMRVAFAI